MAEPGCEHIVSESREWRTESERGVLGSDDGLESTKEIAKEEFKKYQEIQDREEGISWG